MQDPSLVCDLHHSTQQQRIPDPLNKARDQTCILMDIRFISIAPQQELQSVLTSEGPQQMTQISVNSLPPNIYHELLLDSLLLNMSKKIKKYQASENTLLNEKLRPKQI